VHLEAVAVLLGVRHDQVAEGDVVLPQLLREQPAHQVEEVVALVEAPVTDQVVLRPQHGHLAEQRAVHELLEVEVHEDRFQLGGGVPGGQQRGDDRPGRRAREVLEDVPRLLDHLGRPDEGDPLHATPLEHAVDLLDVVCHETIPLPQEPDARPLGDGTGPPA
jgi:hypothetical protein